MTIQRQIDKLRTVLRVELACRRKLDGLLVMCNTCEVLLQNVSGTYDGFMMIV